MSMSRMFLRLAAVRAISARTMAGDRVFDSDLNPLDHRLSAEAQPIVVVYTDDHRESPNGRGDMLMGGNGTMDLVIEVAVAGIVTVEGDVGGAVAIGETDAGMEFTLDLLERQVIAALTAAEGTWPSLWREICTSVSARVSRRGGSAEAGVRYAARQIVLTCSTLFEPPPGVVYGADSTWGRIIAAVASDPKLSALAPILRAELGGPAVADWRQAARILGVNLNVNIGLGDALGLGEDPAPLTDTAVSIGGTVV